MASPSSSSSQLPKPANPNKPKGKVALPIQRNYSNNSNNNSPVSATYVSHRTEGTNVLHGRIRNKKKTRDKRRKSGKKTKRKKRSN